MWIVLGILLLVAGVFLIHETRGTTLWEDEWTWALHRRGNDLGTFLRPHNQHLSLIPILLYRGLFATAGLTHYLPYRLMIIVGHLAVVTLVFVYASRRVGAYLGLLAAALILFFGPGWNDIIWPFQIGWLISLGAGVGALLMLDRRDRAGDVAASVLLGISLASSGPGLAVAVGMVGAMLWERRRWSDAWIVAAPLFLYAIWWIAYQNAIFQRHNIVLVPGFVASAASGVVGALAGLAGPYLNDGIGTLTRWGPPLAIAGVAVLIWRLSKLGRIPPRALTLGTMVVAFWVITALGRASTRTGSIVLSATGYESRYLYVGAFFVVLLVVELAQGVVVGTPARVVIGVLVLAAVVSNIGVLRDGGRFLRERGQLTRTDFGAMELAKPLVKPDYVSQGTIFGTVSAGPYFAATKALGSPAYSQAQIEAAPGNLRLAADKQLIAIHAVALDPSRVAPALGSPPKVDLVTHGTIARKGACVVYTPAPFLPASGTNELRVTVPKPGLRLTVEGGSASVNLRRFGPDFFPPDVGQVHPGTPVTLRIAPDLATVPWHLRVAPAGRTTVCGLA